MALSGVSFTPLTDAANIVNGDDFASAIASYRNSNYVPADVSSEIMAAGTNIVMPPASFQQIHVELKELTRLVKSRGASDVAVSGSTSEHRGGVLHKRGMFINVIRSGAETISEPICQLQEGWNSNYRLWVLIASWEFVS